MPDQASITTLAFGQYASFDSNGHLNLQDIPPFSREVTLVEGYEKPVYFNQERTKGFALCAMLSIFPYPIQLVMPVQWEKDHWAHRDNNKLYVMKIVPDYFRAIQKEKKDGGLHLDCITNALRTISTIHSSQGFWNPNPNVEMLLPCGKYHDSLIVIAEYYNKTLYELLSCSQDITTNPSLEKSLRILLLCMDRKALNTCIEQILKNKYSIVFRDISTILDNLFCIRVTEVFEKALPYVSFFEKIRSMLEHQLIPFFSCRHPPPNELGDPSVFEFVTNVKTVPDILRRQFFEQTAKGIDFSKEENEELNNFIERHHWRDSIENVIVFLRTQMLVKLFTTKESNEMNRLLERYATPAEISEVMKHMLPAESNPFTQELLVRTIVNITKAFFILHENGFAHGDISLNNICGGVDPSPKFIDFGNSSIHSSVRSSLEKEETDSNIIVSENLHKDFVPSDPSKTTDNTHCLAQVSCAPPKKPVFGTFPFVDSRYSQAEYNCPMLNDLWGLGMIILVLFWVILDQEKGFMEFNYLCKAIERLHPKRLRNGEVVRGSSHSLSLFVRDHFFNEIVPQYAKAIQENSVLMSLQKLVTQLLGENEKRRPRSLKDIVDFPCIIHASGL